MVTRMEKELLEAYKKSMEYLESMSALDLMKNAALFKHDLEKLVNIQHLPAMVLVGCLMDEIHRLNTEPDRVLLDDKLTKLFRSFKRYVDEEYMKKE